MSQDPFPQSQLSCSFLFLSISFVMLNYYQGKDPEATLTLPHIYFPKKIFIVNQSCHTQFSNLPVYKNLEFQVGEGSFLKELLMFK